jgi:transcriptional regulator with XRE-family HTH domain
MSRRTRTTAIALTGAVAVSSIAYGLGSQRGDGSAAAVGNIGAAERGHHRGPDIAELADRLGVSSDKLEAALEDLRPDRSGPEDHHAELAADLAAELGVPADRVTAALDKLRGEHGDRHEELTEALATELGVAAAKLRSAFRALRDELGPPRRADHDDFAADLAKELGVSESAVSTALEHAREAKRDEFAAALAQKLGISAAKVEDVLGSLPHHGAHRGP